MSSKSEETVFQYPFAFFWGHGGVVFQFSPNQKITVSGSPPEFEEFLECTNLSNDKISLNMAKSLYVATIDSYKNTNDLSNALT